MTIEESLNIAETLKKYKVQSSKYKNGVFISHLILDREKDFADFEYKKYIMYHYSDHRDWNRLHIVVMISDWVAANPAVTSKPEGLSLARVQQMNSEIGQR